MRYLSHDDVIGRLFSLLEDDGECISIRYGSVDRGNARWYARSHARHDGVGGFIHVIRSLNGSVLGDAPTLSSSSRPPSRLDVVGRMAHLWNAPGARWRKFARRGAPQIVAHQLAPAQAWEVLDSERLAALRSSCDALNTNVSGYLLSCLNMAVAPQVSYDAGPAMWVLPVNMRGAVHRHRPLSNHLSFVPIRLLEDDGPRQATRQMRDRLRDGSHWLLHSVGLAAAGFDRVVPSVPTFADHLRGRSIGLFSNLGSWQVSGPADKAAWVFCPPVTRFLPLSAGAITVGDNLGLMLQAYPSLTMRDEDVRGWLDAWISQINRRVRADRNSIRSDALSPAARGIRTVGRR